MWYSEIISGYLHHYLYIYFLKSFRNVSYQDLKLHYILSTDVTKRSKRSMSSFINFLKFCDVHGGLTCVCKQSLARTGQDAPRALVLSTDKLINFDKRTQTFRYSLTWSDCMSKNRDFIISQKLLHTLVYSTRFVLYTVCSRTDQIHNRHAKDMCLQTRG